MGNILVVMRVFMSAFLFAGSDVQGRSILPQDGVLWVINMDDMVSCRSSAPELRRMRMGATSRIPITVVAVGIEPELMNSFLRTERLAYLPVIHLTKNAYLRQFPQLRAPAMIVVKNNHIIGTFASGNHVVTGRMPENQLIPFVIEHLLE